MNEPVAIKDENTWPRRYPTMTWRWDVEGRERFEVLEFLPGIEASAVVFDQYGHIKTVKASDLRVRP